MKKTLLAFDISVGRSENISSYKSKEINEVILLSFGWIQFEVSTENSGERPSRQLKTPIWSYSESYRPEIKLWESAGYKLFYVSLHHSYSRIPPNFTKVQNDTKNISCKSHQLPYWYEKLKKEDIHKIFFYKFQWTKFSTKVFLKL